MNEQQAINEQYEGIDDYYNDQYQCGYPNCENRPVNEEGFCRAHSGDDE